MISSVVFINQKGEILIYRVFKDDVTRAQAQQFCSKIVATKENRQSPIIYLDGTSFIHISYKDIIILATTKSNINVGMAIQFLYQLLHILKAYFKKQIDQTIIKKNFVLIYQILDQIMDYGMPQIMDPQILKQFIKEGGFDPQIMSNTKKLKQLTNQATGVVSWRKEGIVHKKNQVFIDIYENVNVIMSQKGTILKSDVSGTVIIKAKLTGMPTCQIGMNDKVLMEREGKEGDKGIKIDDLNCHQCVKLSKFQNQRTITFTPPDQSFTLITYKITKNINLPFKLMPLFDQINQKKFQIRLKLKSIFQSTIIANFITVKIPCPKNTIKTYSTTLVVYIYKVGKARYEPDQQAIMWRIKKFKGDFECSLYCSIETGQILNQSIWVKPPIEMEFQIPMFTSSGIRIRYFKCEQKSGYKPFKWIKYVTKSGEYHHRI